MKQKFYNTPDWEANQPWSRWRTARFLNWVYSWKYDENRKRYSSWTNQYEPTGFDNKDYNKLWKEGLYQEVWCCDFDTAVQGLRENYWPFSRQEYDPEYARREKARMQRWGGRSWQWKWWRFRNPVSRFVKQPHIKKKEISIEEQNKRDWHKEKKERDYRKHNHHSSRRSFYKKLDARRRRRHTKNKLNSGQWMDLYQTKNKNYFVDSWDWD